MKRFRLLAALSIALAIWVGLSAAASAGQEILVPCPKLPAGCLLTCVQLDVLTSSFRSDADPLSIELLDGAGSVLASASMATLSGQTRSNFDARVPSEQVAGVRLYSSDGSASEIGWAELRVLCNPCACGCWNTVYKGCLCDWQATVEPVAEVPEEPMPEPLPEMPAPPPAPRPKVVKVPGRG